MPSPTIILYRIAIPILLGAGMGACALEDPLGPESPSVDSPLLGGWRLESRLNKYGLFETATEGQTETRLVGHCDMVGELTVTEVRPSGAVSWTFRRSASCTPSDTVFEAERSHTDTWERTAWGQIHGDQVRFTTPHPVLGGGDPACWFTGVLTLGSGGRRMSGSVECRYPLHLLGPAFYWTGEWVAAPVVVSAP